MKPICIIPARSGSKGLPHKNMLYLDGKPMIFHTIDAAIESGCFDLKDIYVSTDSMLYKEICETKGIRVVLRPEELASDTATTFEVNQQFLQQFPDKQVFVLLQATSPLRSGLDIRKALDLFNSSQAENVVSFSKVDKSPALFTELDENGYAKDIVGIDKGYRRQNSQSILYQPNGAIFISSKEAYLSNQSYFTNKTKAYIMSKKSSIDVDDYLDFRNVIANLFFDYEKREVSQKSMYEKHFQSLSLPECSKILLGDSRLVPITLPNYQNVSVGGVTLARIYDNIELILSTNPEEILLSAGVNDVKSGYSLSQIKHCLKNLVATIISSGSRLSVTTILYSLFRESISNSDISELNDYLFELSTEYSFKIIDINQDLSEDGHLKFEYSSDGLHLNDEGNQQFQHLLESLLD